MVKCNIDSSKIRCKRVYAEKCNSAKKNARERSGCVVRSRKKSAVNGRATASIGPLSARCGRHKKERRKRGDAASGTLLLHACIHAGRGRGSLRVRRVGLPIHEPRVDQMLLRRRRSATGIRIEMNTNRHVDTTAITGEICLLVSYQNCLASVALNPTDENGAGGTASRLCIRQDACNRPVADVGGRYRIDIRISPAQKQRTFARIPCTEVRWPFQTIRIVGKGWAGPSSGSLRTDAQTHHPLPEPDCPDISDACSGRAFNSSPA